MLSQDIYIQRLARSLDATPDELACLRKLGPDELALLWAKVSRQRLAQLPHALRA